MDKNKIKRGFYKTLGNYGYRPNTHVVSTMVEKSIEAKKNIIEVLRKHPNWVEDEMCIILSDKKQERKFSQTAIYDFFAFIQCSAVYSAFDVSKKNRIIQAFIELRKITVQFLGENEKIIVDALNALNPEYRIHYTGKTSKVIKKICKEEGLDNVKDFEKKYAELSDLLNPSEIKVKEIISVNPIDFLEMSNGKDFNWESCHNLYDGCHMAGTISYLLDSVSLLYYQVLEETPINSIHNTSRFLRQVWLYKDECLAQLRLYPQDNDGETSKNLYSKIRTTVLDIFSECLNINDNTAPWLTSHKIAAKIIEKGDDESSAYPDWEIDNPGAHRCNVSKLKTRVKILQRFYAGVTARCISCGSYNYNCESLFCDECGG